MKPDIVYVELYVHRYKHRYIRCVSFIDINLLNVNFVLFLRSFVVKQHPVNIHRYVFLSRCVREVEKLNRKDAQIYRYINCRNPWEKEFSQLAILALLVKENRSGSSNLVKI